MRTPTDTLARLRLDGTPTVLPRPLDALSERWFRAGPRLRLALIVLACVVAVVALGLRLATSPWGTPATVLVTATDLPVGHELGPGDVRAQHWPGEVVPADAIDAADGRRLSVGAPAGTVLTDRHVAAGGVAGALAPDAAAVAVPAELLPSLPSGSSVDLVGAGHDGAGTVMAADVEVLRADGDRVWFGVPRSAAADVAAAAAAGQLTAVLLPP